MAINEKDIIFDDQKCFEPRSTKTFYRNQCTEHNWFENYLKDRQQFASLNGDTPSSQMTKTGATQSSLLGPFLFRIFTNDVPQHITNAYNNTFADGSVIETMGESLNEIRLCYRARNARLNNNNLPADLRKIICMLISSSAISIKLRTLIKSLTCHYKMPRWVK